MCDHILRRATLHFCRCCLQAFTTEKILKRHSNGCFKISGKQITIMSKEDGYVKFKNYEVTVNNLCRF